MRPTAFLSVITAMTCAFASQAQAETLFGLSGPGIVVFDSATPGTISATKPFTGLGGDTVVSIDLRPQDNLLYAFTSGNRVFSLDMSGASAAGTLVFDLATNPLGTPTATGTLSTLPPTGNVSIDFNPVANALRLIDTNDNNYRRSFANGNLFLDGLIDIGGDGSGVSIVAEAYTRNGVGLLTTQLYSIDALTNMIYLQNPPNDGTLTAGMGLGIDIPTFGVGFEISGLGGNGGNAYLSANANGSGNAELYAVNVTTGATSLVGEFSVVVTDIAAAVPEPASAVMLFAGCAGLLARRRRQR